ncbi:hypothetical protein MJO29_011511 [Puccinia striiformis f. sp. tritici]|nr:hypothetical protein MJO29_011511 [Puccinia striiformis f. sp. tritici]
MVNAVTNLQKSVLYIHASLARLAAFGDALALVRLNPDMKLPTKDMPTRWNATYLMIESSLPCKLAFKHLDMEDKNYKSCPSDVKYNQIVAMKSFLEPFFKATNTLSGTRYPTMNLGYQAMRKIEKEIDNYSSANTTNNPLLLAVVPMKAKFNKYWDSMKDILEIGLVIDPRFKMQYLRFTLEESPLLTAMDNDIKLCKVCAGILDLCALYVSPPGTAETSFQAQNNHQLDEETA